LVQGVAESVEIWLAGGAAGRVQRSSAFGMTGSAAGGAGATKARHTLLLQPSP